VHCKSSYDVDDDDDEFSGIKQCICSQRFVVVRQAAYLACKKRKSFRTAACICLILFETMLFSEAHPDEVCWFNDVPYETSSLLLLLLKIYLIMLKHRKSFILLRKLGFY